MSRVDTNMREAGLEREFHSRVRNVLGGMAIKVSPTLRGLPDRLVFLPGGRIYLVELKTTTGRRSPIQEVTHERLALLGVEVATLYGLSDIVRWVRDRMDEQAAPSGRQDTTTRAPRGFRWVSNSNNTHRHLLAGKDMTKDAVCGARPNGVNWTNTRNKPTCTECESASFVTASA